MNGRRLVVMRHAKSSWKDNLPDLQRPLSGRGRRDAKEAGRLFVRAGLRPDVVLCSPAQRTRQTHELLAGQGAAVTPAQIVPEVYDADGPGLVDLVRQQPPDAGIVMLLGHWPAVADVVPLLAEREPTQQWLALTEKFPTSALAIIHLPGPWRSAGDASGTLRSFHVPRGTR